MKTLRSVLCVAGLAVAASAAGAAGGDLEPGWPVQSPDSRPWARWWWPGSAVGEEGLKWQLGKLHDAGIGGMEVTPIYGARGYEDRYVDFLSPRWVALLGDAGRDAAALGMRVDMATGTGWPFGGPNVQPAEAAQKLVLQDGKAVAVPTGQKVKRAAPGGEGLVLDPYSATAMRDYLKRFDAAFARLPQDTLRAQFHDSFEYYDADWTPGLPAAFERLNGYRVEPFLPLLLGADAGADADKVARIRHDFRITLDHLHRGYLQAWHDWAHGHGWLVRNQSHGAPANLLDLYAIADIPETEYFGSIPFPIAGLRREEGPVSTVGDLPDSLVARMASSAAHVAGHRLTSSETATWLGEHWQVTLAQIKPEVDRAFLDGVNHIIFHGTVYSPPDVPWPGWFFYASTQFNPQNTWWRDVPALTAYIDRVQRVLQGGAPGSDVLLYWPVHEVWQDAKGPLMKQLAVHNAGWVREHPFGAVAARLKKAGYAFDYISDDQVAGLKVARGALQAPGGEYQTLVVPPASLMPVATLRALLALARDGATVVFVELPGDVPGWGRLDERRKAFHDLLASIPRPGEPGADGVAAEPFGKGRLIFGRSLPALEHTGARREPMADLGLECIRRRTSGGWDYFVSNLTEDAVDAWLPLGEPVQSAVLLDPLGGEGGVAALRPAEGGLAQVRVHLASGQSVILRCLTTGEAKGPAWRYLTPQGDATTLAGPWHLVFEQGGPTLPAAIDTDALKSWTELGGADAQAFAGTVRYATHFTLPARADAAGWRLDLGDLRDSARVTVNGHLAGTVWCLPFQIPVGHYLHAGDNTLEIEVTNVAANRIRDLDRRGVDWKIMREINLVNIDYRRFDASDWPVKPAGLLGPVKLVPMGPAKAPPTILSH